MGIICCRSQGKQDALDALADLEDSDDDDGQVPDGAGRCNGIDIQKALTAHNELRAKHGAPPLAWDNTCAQHALAQAQICNDLGSLEHGNSTQFGEGQNLWMTMGFPAPVAGAKEACADWYSEIDSYDFDSPGFGMSTGHFTQLVWKGTSKVGMAKVIGESRGMTAIWIAANYSPAGNMQGDFPNNVCEEQ